MSRPWTGWVLTAAAIAAGPAPALSSNESPRPLQAILAQAAAVPPAGGGTDCLELVTPPEFKVLHNGEVLVLKKPYPTSKADGDIRSDAARVMLPRLSLPEGTLLPDGAMQPAQVRAACGIPKGLTLLSPALVEP